MKSFLPSYDFDYKENCCIRQFRVHNQRDRCMDCMDEYQAQNVRL